MDKSLLVKLIGFPATLLHSDPHTYDRWRWLKRRLPETRNGEKLIDIGCGTGAFTIGPARRGYESLGLSWDERNQKVAGERAAMCKAPLAKFEILDVRKLDSREDLIGQFDYAICSENIEHILDDRKLMRDIAACLKPGGRLLLTTPYLLYRPIAAGDMGPFCKVETGWHVRRGYTQVMLEELCRQSGLLPERFSFCSGFFSQKVAGINWKLSRISLLLGWAFILPLRILPPMFDWLIFKVTRYPHTSICMEAYKPRWTEVSEHTVATNGSIRKLGNENATAATDAFHIQS